MSKSDGCHANISRRKPVLKDVKNHALLQVPYDYYSLRNAADIFINKHGNKKPEQAVRLPTLRRRQCN